MRLPNFLIMGAAKSGTTTLYKYLCRHPQVFMSIPKEPNFFANNNNYAMGIEWYANLFAKSQATQILGEATTSYTHRFYIPDVPERIFNTIPDVKLIYIMRHPVDRAYSQYLQQIKLAQIENYTKGKSFKIPESFDSLIQRGDNVYDTDDYMEKIDVLRASNYMRVINEYLQFFDRKSFLFLLFDDLIKDPSRTIERVVDFLNLDKEVDLLEESQVKENVSSNHYKWYIRSQITAPLKAIPVIRSTYNLFPQEARDFVYKLISKLSGEESVSKKCIPKPMLPATREMLLEKFYQPNLDLAKFINRDLSHWNQ